VNIEYGCYLSLCPNRNWFSSFKKLDGCYIVMGDGHLCNMKGISNNSYQDIWWDGARAKESKVCTSIEEIFYLNWCFLEALGLKISCRDGVLKMLQGSMVVMKDIKHNNLYYFKGNTVIGQVTTFISSDDDCIRLWHMRLEYIGENSLQVLAKQGLFKGAKTCIESLWPLHHQ